MGKDGSPEGTAIGHHLFKACFLSSDSLEITGEQGCLCKIREAQLRLRQIRFIHSGSCEDGAVQIPMAQIQSGQIVSGEVSLFAARIVKPEDMFGANHICVLLAEPGKFFFFMDILRVQLDAQLIAQVIQIRNLRAILQHPNEKLGFNFI